MVSKALEQCCALLTRVFFRVTFRQADLELCQEGQEEDYELYHLLNCTFTTVNVQIVP